MQIIIGLSGHKNFSGTRGVGVYTRELISNLQHFFKEDHFIPTSHHSSQVGIDLIHYPFFDPFIRSLHVPKKIPTVITIHDLTPLKFPLHFPVGIRGKINYFFQKRSVMSAKAIITDSECSKKDIQEILSYPSDKIFVIPLAHTVEKVPTQIGRRIAKKYALPERYLLYVGDINWNKNVTGLIDAFKNINDPTLHLVLVGKVFSDKPNIPEYQAVAKAITDSQLESRIHLLGFVPSHHLPVLYRYAEAYVQPSWYEGFGFPVLEAMSYGTPVACSNRGSLPEVGGDAVAYFDPDKDMAKVIVELLTNTRRRNLLIQKGLERVKLFSWEKVAVATHAVYEKILHSNI